MTMWIVMGGFKAGPVAVRNLCGPYNAGTCWVTERLTASREGLCCLELVKLQNALLLLSWTWWHKVC